MSNVLIWRKMSPGNELDIFHPTDYSTLYSRIVNDWNGIPQNWGNRVWFQGIYSVIDNGENNYSFLDDTIDIDLINNSFDFIILSLANIFSIHYIKGLSNYSDIFEKIKIPVYVIACGVQAESYDDLDNVIDAIGKESKRFIRAIYNTGGEFALRGYFTKQFFDKLGFKSAVVTGCPSLFQLGCNLQINNSKLEHSEIMPVFNGFFKSFETLLNKFPSSQFIDQCEFTFPLYQHDYLDDINLKFKLEFINKFSISAAEMLSSGRICMIADTNDWWNFLQNKHFNFSFGTRIHGTIMSILSGIPSTIVSIDSRTKEMAEFFNIPLIEGKQSTVFSKNDLFNAYEKMDYSTFNSSFNDKFNSYEQFFIKNGIVTHLNQNNQFFFRQENNNYNFIPYMYNKKFNSFYNDLTDDKLKLTVIKNILKLKKRIF